MRQMNWRIHHHKHHAGARGIGAKDIGLAPPHEAINAGANALGASS